MEEIKKIPFDSTWDIRHKVMWPDQPFDFIQLPNDKDGLHYGLFVNDKLTSIVSAWISKDEAQFRKFATLQAEQGKGYGTKLLTFLLAELETNGINKVWCNARVAKTQFYERFSLHPTEKTYIKGGIDFVVLEKIGA